MKKISLAMLILLSLFSFTTIDTPEGLQVNDNASDFTSKDQNGKTINLKELIQQGSVVLFFIEANGAHAATSNLFYYIG